MTGLSKQFIVVPNINEIIDVLVSHIARNTFLYNTTITGVSQFDKNVILTTDQGYILQTKIVIFATPIHEMLKMSFLPDLPFVISTAHDYYVTIFEAQFDLAHWQTNGFSGFILLHNPHFLCYPYQAERNTLRGTIYHSDDDDVTVEYILNQLNLEFGTSMRPLYWYQRTFRQSPIQDTSTMPTKLWNSIIFASSEFGFSYRNRMNGAVQAGQRAAILAILTLRPQLFLKEDAYFLRPAFEFGESISFWRYLNSDIMLYDILFYSFVLTFLISSV